MTASPRTGRTPDPSLPFFAYGIFKPGEIAFFQIRAFVAKSVPATTRGELLLRDGVPVLDTEIFDHDEDGYKITFTRVTGVAPTGPSRPWNRTLNMDGSVEMV